ncbi:MAG: carbonic anhydrase, partial [Pseudomonadota bacterium]
MDEAIQKLIRGFHRFRTRYFETEQTLYQRLTQQGQSPQIMVIACCDARVDPALITDSDPGDLFVVRNVANLVPPQETGGHYHGTSAAIEFAVRSLRVRHIIVRGHARCGGIHALLQGSGDANASGQYIQPWMAIADEARTVALAAHGDPSSDAAQRTCEQAAIR